MAIDYHFLKDLLNEIPEVKTLLKERDQIKRDGKKKGSYTKPSPHLTPSNDKFHPKKHKYNNSKDLALQKITKERLKENAKKIEKVVYDTLEKREDTLSLKELKDLKTNELVTFIEKGREQVIKNREKKKSKEVCKQEKKPEKEIDKVQEAFDKKIEYLKEEQMFDRLQQAFDNMRWDTKKEQAQENKKDIERDRGFSR